MNALCFLTYQPFNKLWLKEGQTCFTTEAPTTELLVQSGTVLLHGRDHPTESGSKQDRPASRRGHSTNCWFKTGQVGFVAGSSDGIWFKADQSGFTEESPRRTVSSKQDCPALRRKTFEGIWCKAGQDCFMAETIRRNLVQSRTGMLYGGSRLSTNSGSKPTAFISSATASPCVSPISKTSQPPEVSHSGASFAILL